MKRITFILGLWMVTSLLVFGILLYITLGQSRKTKSEAVITQLQELARYETASFTVEKIIDVGDRTNVIQDFLFGDRLLLVAHGSAIAGFDLSMLQNDDLEIDGDVIKLSLPEPQLLLVTLDNDKTQVYDRETGVFTSPDTGLEREARLIAEDEIVKAACEADLLETASENAKKQLTLFFEGMGFAKVDIQIPDATCSR